MMKSLRNHRANKSDNMHNGRNDRKTLRFESLESRNLLTTVTWDGGGGNLDWNTPLNWTTDSVPTAADDVIIPELMGEVTISHNSGATVVNSLTTEESLSIGGGSSISIATTSSINGDLSISAATLDGTGDLTVGGLLSITGFGYLSSAGTTTASGGIHISNGTIQDGTVDSPAITTWAGGKFSVADATFNNLSGATFNIVGIGNDAGGSLSGTFNNVGTVHKSVGTGVSTFGMFFNNTGTVTIDTGTLGFSGGGSTDSAFLMGLNTNLQFTYGGPEFDMNTNQVIPGNLNISGAKLGGTGDLTVEGLLSLNGYGSLMSHGTTTANGGIYINNGTIWNGTVNSPATTTWAGGKFSMIRGAEFNNLSTATFEIVGDGPGGGGQGSTFNNAGIVRKSTGSGTSQFGMIFNNTGTVEILTGGLGFSGGGSTDSAFLMAEDYNMANDDTYLRFDYGGNAPAFEFNVDQTVPGALTISAGKLGGTGNLTIEGLLHIGGYLQSHGTTTANGGITIYNGIIQNGMVNSPATSTWTGGYFSMSNDATFNNLAGATFNIVGDGVGGGHDSQFVNAGTVHKSTSTGTSRFGMKFFNTGTVKIDTGGLDFWAGGSTNSAFDMAPGTNLTFTHYASPAFDFGIVNQIIPGNLSISGGKLDGSGSLTVGGLLSITANGYLRSSGTTTANGGIYINQGYIYNGTVNSPATTTWSGGRFDVRNGATFNNLSTATFEIVGDGSGSGTTGEFNNAGIVRKSAGSGISTLDMPFNNTGTVEVNTGDSIGSIVIQGNYVQTSMGSLDVGLAGASNDDLFINGTVTLDGSLNVSLTGGFIPSSGQTFKVLENNAADAIVGTFNGLPEGAILLGEAVPFEISYVGGDGNDVVLTVLSNQSPTVVAPLSNTATEDDASFIIQLLTGASDPDASDILNVDALTLSSGDDSGVTIGVNSLTVDPSAYNDLANGESEMIVYGYNVIDGNGGSVAQTATITITGVNHGPSADDDGVDVYEDDGITDVTGTLLDGDTDLDSDALSVSAIDATGTTGTVTLSMGVVNYDPNGQFESLADGEMTTDTFGYTVSDGEGGTDTATVTVTITGQNDAPVADDDGVDVNEDDNVADITATLLNDDADSDTSDTLVISAINAVGTTGTVTLVNGAVNYDPNGQFESLADGEMTTDTFGYTVSDGDGGTDTATVTVTITGQNDAPSVAVPLSNIAVNEDDPNLVLDVSDVFADVDTGDILSVAIFSNSNPTLLTATLGSSLTLDFLPDQSGTAVVTLLATDGQLSIENSFTVTVVSASEQVILVIDEIEALADIGDISAGNAGALTSKLEGSLDKLDADKINAAVNQLNAFINQVNAFVGSGKLTAEQGAELITLVEATIASAAEGGGAALVSEGLGDSSSDARPLDNQGELLVGNIGVSLSSLAGDITEEQVARLDDALVKLNETFGLYGLTLVTLDAPATTDAEINVTIANDSACGGLAEGILGCTSGPGEITVIADWSWHVGVDQSTIGASQYDFQTVLTHEVGHAVGLTHSGDDASVMYSWLLPAETKHTLSTQDLDLLAHHDESGPAPLRAMPRDYVSERNNAVDLTLAALAADNILSQPVIEVPAERVLSVSTRIQRHERLRGQDGTLDRDGRPSFDQTRMVRRQRLTAPRSSLNRMRTVSVDQALSEEAMLPSRIKLLSVRRTGI